MKDKLTPEQALRALEDIRDGKADLDVEEGHMKADRILCDLLRFLGHGEIADAFGDIEKWYA